MAHFDSPLLDNPIWNALTTDHAGLAQGDDQARRYPSEIGPLSGIPHQSEASYASLSRLAGEYPVVLFSLDPIRTPQGWITLRTGEVVQMVRNETSRAPSSAIEGAPSYATASSSRRVGDDSTSLPGAPEPALSLPKGLSPLETWDGSRDSHSLRQLTPAEAPAMVALAELTEPGPFRLRTIELGNFYGIFHGNRLVSMAGKRMHIPGFVEVSGVCTHPAARGRGYARTLMQIVIGEIEQSGRTPFLHAWADNPAVHLYQALGFSLTRRFDLAVLKLAV